MFKPNPLPRGRFLRTGLVEPIGFNRVTGERVAFPVSSPSDIRATAVSIFAPQPEPSPMRFRDVRAAGNERGESPRPPTHCHRRCRFRSRASDRRQNSKFTANRRGLTASEIFTSTCAHGCATPPCSYAFVLGLTSIFFLSAVIHFSNNFFFFFLRKYLPGFFFPNHLIQLICRTPLLNRTRDPATTRHRSVRTYCVVFTSQSSNR